MTLPKYQVTLTKEVWYTIRVTADNEDAAIEQAWNKLESQGIRMFKRTGEEWVGDATHVEEE